jgi:hypothetical protein
MQPKKQRQDELRIFKFRIGLAGNPHIDLNLSGYLYDGNGTLVEGADIWRDELLLALTETELAGGTLLIAPYPTDAFTGSHSSTRDLMARQAFRLKLTLQPGQEEYILPDIPESVWREWLTASSPEAERRQELNLDFLFY